MLIGSLYAARDLGRLEEIVGVLARHGLGDLARRLGWADGLERAGGSGQRLAQLARLAPPSQVRLALEELGPTFVKLGQIMAGRADLFAPEWIAEFEKLQSHVAAVPFSELHPQLTEDLGGEPANVFARFDETPLAAASIAQVHRAQLQDGTEVVVKVRRPGIQQVIEADLRLLVHLTALATRHWPELRPFRPVQLVQEFGHSLRRELDLAHECRNAERISVNFRMLPSIVIPRVHWAYTHERVNVQDFIEGIPGDDLERIEREGLSRRELARLGSRAVLKMVVEDGFFHADPHPGNVFYLSGNRIAFIDFGMVGQLSSRRQDEMLKLMLGLVEREAAAVTDVLLEWADGHAQLREDALSADVAGFIDAYHGVPLAQLSLSAMLSDVTRILRDHRLSLPSDLALLVKAFISVEGMGRVLDPEFHMALEVLPVLQREFRARLEPRHLARRGWSTWRRMFDVALAAPGDLTRWWRLLRRRGIEVHVDILHLDRFGERLDRAASRLTVGLVVAALIIGSSIVMTVGGGPTLFGLPAFGLLGFVGACIGGVWLLRSIASREQRDDE